MVFGLRFENRTWVNQFDGLVEVASYLAKKSKKLKIIVDGHNTATGKTTLIKSHKENDQHGIIKMEKSIVSALQNAQFGDHVSIIDCVDVPLAFGINQIEKCDFFVAPWGAGLVKYKWVCNKPGVIFTSGLNVKHKPDLKIYESTYFREGASVCHYVNERYVTVVNEADLVVDLLDGMRVNFVVDVQGIYEQIDLLLEGTGSWV